MKTCCAKLSGHLFKAGYTTAGIIGCIVVHILFSFSTSSAEVYQWIADDGSVTFKDTPPPVTGKKKVKIYSNSDFAPAPPKAASPEPRSSGNKTAVSPPIAVMPEKRRFSGTVEIYLTSWCGYCKKALNYMSSNGIPFVAYDIEKDSAASRRHKDLGGRGVPLIIIGSNKMSGFSVENFEYYLNNSN